MAKINVNGEIVETRAKDIGYDAGIQRPIFEEGGFKSVAVDTTLTAEDHGKTIYCSAVDVVVTLPPTEAGLRFQVFTGVASGGTGVSVSPDAADQIIGNGFTAADDKDAINAGASDVVGDILEVTGNGTTGWLVTKVKGTWAREA